MDPTTATVLKALIALILFLISLLVSTISTAMSRHEGASWTTAIKQGFKGFVAAATLLTVLYTAFITLP